LSPKSSINSINVNSTAIHSCNALKTWQIKHVLNSGYLIDSSVSLVQTQRATHSYSSDKVGLILLCSSTETKRPWSLFLSSIISSKQILIQQYLFVSQTSWRFSHLMGLKSKHIVNQNYISATPIMLNHFSQADNHFLDISTSTPSLLMRNPFRSYY